MFDYVPNEAIANDKPLIENIADTFVEDPGFNIKKPSDDIVQEEEVPTHFGRASVRHLPSLAYEILEEDELNDELNDELEEEDFSIYPMPPIALPPSNSQNQVHFKVLSQQSDELTEEEDFPVRRLPPILQDSNESEEISTTNANPWIDVDDTSPKKKRLTLVDAKKQNTSDLDAFMKVKDFARPKEDLDIKADAKELADLEEDALDSDTEELADLEEDALDSDAKELADLEEDALDSDIEELVDAEDTNVREDENQLLADQAFPSDEDLKDFALEIKNTFGDDFQWQDLAKMMNVSCEFLDAYPALNYEEKKEALITVLENVVDITDTSCLPDDFFDPLFKAMLPSFAEILFPENIDASHLNLQVLKGSPTQKVLKKYKENIVDMFEDGFEWNDLASVVYNSYRLAHQFVELSNEEKCDFTKTLLDYVVDNTDTPYLPDHYSDPIFKAIAHPFIEMIAESL